jgi:hypothetical protein
MRTSPTFSSALILLLFAWVEVARAQSTPVLVGILEDNPGVFAGDPHYRDVRIVFRRDRSGWTALPHTCRNPECLKSLSTKLPPEVAWTIAFDGRSLGSVNARTPSSFQFYASVGQQEIEGTSPAPSVGKPSVEFAGFLGEPVLRPLVAISQPNYHDPEGWKRISLPPQLEANVRAAFRKRFPKVENCSRQNVEKSRPWAYADSHLTVARSYGSNRGWMLAEIVLRESLCDYTDDEAFNAQWFAITPQHEVRFLDSSMWLVDAGDYDADGHSELVFSIDDDNRGGYKLFYNDFAGKVTFEFSYH